MLDSNHFLLVCVWVDTLSVDINPFSFFSHCMDGGNTKDEDNSLIINSVNSS